MRHMKIKTGVLSAAAVLTVFGLAACEPITQEEYLNRNATATEKTFELPPSDEPVDDPSEAAESDSASSDSATLPNHIATIKPMYDDGAMIKSPYGICFDLTDNILIYGKDIDNRKTDPAATVKLAAALTAIQNLPEDAVFTVGSVSQQATLRILWV